MPVSTPHYMQIAWLTIITAALAWLIWERFTDTPQAAPAATTGDFDEINVERLNIVEPNGRYRLVLSNSARFPGLFMAGKEYKHHSRAGGGMLFFNDDGDEAGGLTIHSAREGDAHVAHAGIMFDQFKQDQTVGLIYNDQNGKRTAGMRVWDRPEHSIETLMKMSDRAARAPSDAEREKLRKEMIDYAMAHGGLGAERMFAGKSLEDAVVRLADRQGRPRLQLLVDGKGDPRVEFLDTEGKVLKSITAN